VQAEVRDLNFGRVHLVAKVLIAFFMYSCRSVRLPECINAAPTGRIYVEFDVGNFYEILPRGFKFG
jgi:hypothetical protein